MRSVASLLRNFLNELFTPLFSYNYAGDADAPQQTVNVVTPVTPHEKIRCGNRGTKFFIAGQGPDKFGKQPLQPVLLQRCPGPV